MSRPFDLAAHTFLLSIGYVHEHNPSTYEDVGDGESGPMLIGCAAFDLYSSDTDYVAIDDMFAEYHLRDIMDDYDDGEGA